MPSLTLSLDDLWAWTEEERAKWEAWFPAHPEALEFVLRGDKFGTVGGLVGHSFEAEWRQAHRFGAGPVPERKDPVGLGIPELFDYGRRARAFFRAEAAKMSAAAWDETIAFQTASGPVTLTKRKLALHLPLHEIRHWAQIARTVREHDLAPPGRHDFAFSDAVA